MTTLSAIGQTPLPGIPTSPTSTGGVGTGSPASTKPATTTPDVLGKDAFLKLLVAQLKYQDPLNPAKGTEFVAQTAQFSMVEAVQQMSKQNTDMLAAQRTLAGGALIGKTITYDDPDKGIPVAGVVTGARFDGSSVVLMVGDREIPLASVKEVTSGQPAPTSAGSASPSP